MQNKSFNSLNLGDWVGSYDGVITLLAEVVRITRTTYTVQVTDRKGAALLYTVNKSTATTRGDNRTHWHYVGDPEAVRQTNKEVLARLAEARQAAAGFYDALRQEVTRVHRDMVIETIDPILGVRKAEGLTRTGQPLLVIFTMQTAGVWSKDLGVYVKGVKIFPTVYLAETPAALPEVRSLSPITALSPEAALIEAILTTW